MKILIMFLSFLLLTSALFAGRASGYGISDAVELNTVIPYHDESSFALSGKFSFTTLMGAGGFAVSEAVTLETGGQTYSSYRIVTVSQAPNPAILEVPEGGIGYAWFVVEGEDEYSNWLPVSNIDILAEDEQGNIIPCEANRLPFQFLTDIFHFQNAGVFAIPIDADIIGNGMPGDQETITVTTANGETISPENRRSITAEIVPYEYTAKWGYRLYAKGGAGVTAGVITATGFVGGGSGAEIELSLKGTETNPDWNNFKIFRRDDIFLGVEVGLGPPTLIDTGLDPSVEVTASFPYQHEFEFDIDDLEGLEALMAYYLFAEPSILYTSGGIPGGQIVTNFLSWCVEALIENSGQNGLGIVRIADETGLDIEGSISVSTDILEGLDLGMSMGASLGANTHLGGSTRYTETEEINRRLYVGGGYDFSLGIGPKFIPAQDVKCNMIYPFRLNNTPIPTNLEVNFEYYGTWQNTSWQSTKLSASLASNSSALNIYDLPGQIQEYTAWLNIDDTDVKNILLNYTELPSEMWNIGSTAVSVAIDNESFKQDYVNFLSKIYDEQNDDLPVQLEYGFDAKDKSEYSVDLDLEFPLPVLPAIVINLGGGIEATNSREYELSKGYWVKGLPYLQTEMPNPPQPGETFVSVMEELWDKVISGDVLSELTDVVLAHLDGFFFFWNSRTDEQIVELNDRGSTLTIRENSIPAGVDSVLFRNWEWDEEPENTELSNAQKNKITNYNTRLRELREEIAGMRYGIGGFFKFEPTGEVFGDSTLISIAYADSEVVDINESYLSVYWENNEGVWNPLPSIVYPDSNLVKAWIPDFQTYTLAPRLPQGSFGLISDPDSIAADGVSVAQIISETLYNNDGTIIEDGSLFTVQTTRGTITSIDEDTEIVGTQVSVSSGIIQFEVQSDSISVPITLTANSVQGYATCEMELILYDVSIPETPVLLSLEPEHNSLRLTWEEINIPDLAGYKIYYDNDGSGAPYNGTANYQGVNSPVVVGEVNEHILTGLSNDETYYVSITAFDVSEVESSYSNELTESPELQAISDLSIEKVTEGINLSWSPVFGANSYKIYRGIDPYADISEMVFITEINSTSWIDTNISGVSKYFYIVVVVAY
ncbi:MAG: hypothetical protein KAU01_04865 [Candidatus Cloacimonetes bacterium]|nr:hypothetical protein [Candidatus Cloacimonadota bacterium]